MGWSTTKIGEKLNVSQSTIRDDLQVSNNTNLPNRTIGKDGKSYPARRPSVMIKNNQEMQHTLDALSNIPADQLPNKIIDAKRAARLSREYKAEQKSQSSEDIIIGSAQLLLGDFRERSNEIPDESIDLIFTDPPYPEEYLPLWSDLSKIANRVLKSGGLLIAYSGQTFLPKVIQRLNEHLDYIWLGALFLQGQHNQIHAKKIKSHSKPLLFYGKNYQPTKWITDTYWGEGKNKELHDWQQSIGPARYYINELTKPGQVVFDPFLGSGTTGVAAIELGRYFIGCENDKVAFAAAKERIDNGTRGNI
jgi:site-specific DNA-methyltransferase (adenine-specific)